MFNSIIVTLLVDYFVHKTFVSETRRTRLEFLMFALLSIAASRQSHLVSG